MVLPWLLLVELALYASCFVCGIVTAASLTINQGNLGGLCMLYGTVQHNSTTNAIEALTASPSSLCYFVSAISVSVAVMCFSLSLYWLYTCCIDGEVRRGRMWINLTLAVCGVFLFFLLITGCILKIGRDSLCNSVTHAVPNITRCEEAESRTWANPFNGAQFYTSLHKAEVGYSLQFYLSSLADQLLVVDSFANKPGPPTAVWVNFFFWLIIGVLVTLQRGQSSGFKMVGGLGTAGSVGGEPGVTPSETEPFFNRPPRPQ